MSPLQFFCCIKQALEEIQLADLLMKTTTDLFLHIPRSGGSSLRTLLTLNYMDEQVIGLSGRIEELSDFLKLPSERRNSYRLIHGHFPFGLHAGIEDFRYFTLIRDPIARLFSEYYYAKKYPEHHAHEAINDGSYTLERWVELGEEGSFYHSNALCQYLSGNYQLNKPTHSTFQAACSNLEKFHVFGLTHRFQESALMIAKYLDWRFPVYAKRNVIMGEKKIPEAISDRAKEVNEWDVALYEYASELFEKRVQDEKRLLFPALEFYEERVTQASGDEENTRQRHLVEGLVGDAVLKANEIEFESPINEYLESPKREREMEFRPLPVKPILDYLKVVEASQFLHNPQVFSGTYARIWWLGFLEMKDFPRLAHRHLGGFSYEGLNEEGFIVLQFDDERVGKVFTSKTIFPLVCDVETRQWKRFLHYKTDNVSLDVLDGDVWDVVENPYKPVFASGNPWDKESLRSPSSDQTSGSSCGVDADGK